MRYIWLIGGLLSVALGAIGIILPLLPTVPFLLLAAFCFARSSEFLHNWMLTHPKLGPPISDWQENGAIGLNAKRLATLSVIAVFGLSLALGARPLVLGIQAITLGCVMLFIWTRPHE
ncbi:MAG: YbaN family protein [Cognatishimia sp.]